LWEKPEGDWREKSLVEIIGTHARKVESSIQLAQDKRYRLLIFPNANARSSPATSE